MESDATDVAALEEDPTQVHADSLARYFVTMREIAVDLDRLARAEVPPTSRLAADERTAREAGGSLVLTPYIQERAATAARFLSELHRSTLEADPGQLTLDFVLLYPTMRAGVENSAALTWLLSPKDRPERLERLIRVLRRDSVNSSPTTSASPRPAMTASRYPPRCSTNSRRPWKPKDPSPRTTSTARPAR